MPAPSVWSTFLFAQAIVWLPLIAGHQLHRRGLVPERLSAQLHKGILYLFSPVIGALALWRLEREMADWFWSPLAMLILMLISNVGAWFLAQRLSRDRPRIGTLILMFSISNTGFTMAGMMTLVLVGEHAFAYNALISPQYFAFLYLIWIPIGQFWSPLRDRGQSRAQWRGEWLRTAVINMLPLAGMGVGAVLSYRDVPMDEGWRTCMRWLTYAVVAIVMFAVGCKVRLRRSGSPLQPLLLWTYALKFVAFPALILLICAAAGLRGDLAAALLLAAAAPVGVNAPGLSTIYGLDIDLANAGYIWTTLIYMLVVVPLMMLALGLPFFH